MRSRLRHWGMRLLVSEISLKFSESKLYEDIVAMYLSKTLNNGIVSVYKQGIEKTPDFIVENVDRPLTIEVGIGKGKTDRFSHINCRYGILLNQRIRSISKEKNYIRLPLKWFLLL